MLSSEVVNQTCTILDNKNLSADAKRFHGLEAHVDEVFGHIDILFISKSF